MAGCEPPDQQALYDRMWQDYGHLDAVSPAAFHRRRVIIDLARKHAAQARNVLDVGCGQGELLRQLAAAIPSATLQGADLSEQSLRTSRQRNPTHTLFQLDLGAPDFTERYASRIGDYDCCICSEVLEHIPDHALATAHLRSLLRPGGTAIVTVPGGKMSAFDRSIGHQRHYTVDGLRALLSGAGLTVIELLAWGFPFHNLYRTAVRVAARFTVPSERDELRSEPGKGAFSRVLAGAYSVFGRALKPLYYLNAARGGEQLIAVARRET